MPKIIIHTLNTSFDPDTRQSIAAELTDCALDCEALPKSPFVKSTAWTYFNVYDVNSVFMGDKVATLNVVSVQIFVIEGGLTREAKQKLIKVGTAIIGQHLEKTERVPVYIVIHEIAEINWGIFGANADLAALRASAPDAAAL